MQTERQANLQEENLIYLRSWAGATEREIQGVFDAIAPLERRIEKLRERLDLISRLADLVEADLRGVNEPVTTIDLTERAGDESGQDEAARSEPVLEGQIRQILDTP